MSSITPASVARVRRDAPIRSVLGKAGTIMSAGSKEKMRCIAHNDKNPSLQIDPIRNNCHCWSCGWGGDVIEAYMKVQEVNNTPVDFPTAVRALAAEYNIPIEETATDPHYKEAAAAAKQRTAHAFSLHQYVADHYHDQLHQEIGYGPSKTTAHAYFTARGLTQATIDAFHLGGAPHTSHTFVQTLHGQGYTTEDIAQYELFREDRNHDWQSTIHDRVVYPIQNHMGQVVGFAGRILPSTTPSDSPNANATQNKAPKYINSSVSDIYHKKELLYGLFQAKSTISKQDHCYIVEGYQDVLAMHQAGITETVAVCGVALSKEQVRMLHNFTDQITLMLDGDTAGQTAMLRHLEVLLPANYYVNICILPDNQDPDDYLRTYLHNNPNASREELLSSLATHTQDWLTHCAQLLAPLNGKPLRQAQENLFKLISVMPDKVRQESAIRQVAKLLDISYDIVTYEVSKQASQHPAQFLVPKSGEVPRRGGVVESKNTPKQQQTEKTILRHLVLYGTYRITPDDPTTAIAHWIYQDLQQDAITLQNPILQQLLEATYQAHTDWLATQDDQEAICYRPYTLVSHLQCHPDPIMCECTTRIYNQQRSREFTYGDDAHPSIEEVLDTMETQVLHLKIGIIETHIKKLSQSIYDALEQDNIEKYKELNQEKTRWTEMLRVAWGKMRE